MSSTSGYTEQQINKVIDIFDVLDAEEWKQLKKALKVRGTNNEENDKKRFALKLFKNLGFRTKHTKASYKLAIELLNFLGIDSTRMKAERKNAKAQRKLKKQIQEQIIEGIPAAYEERQQRIAKRKQFASDIMDAYEARNKRIEERKKQEDWNNNYNEEWKEIDYTDDIPEDKPEGGIINFTGEHDKLLTKLYQQPFNTHINFDELTEDQKTDLMPKLKQWYEKTIKHTPLTKRIMVNFTIDRRPYKVPIDASDNMAYIDRFLEKKI